jgi:hypothetical protein
MRKARELQKKVRSQRMTEKRCGKPENDGEKVRKARE